MRPLQTTQIFIQHLQVNVPVFRVDDQVIDVTFDVFERL